MNAFNKYEVIGIFFSIAIMAIALSVVRFQINVIALGSTLMGDTQGAVVSVADDERVDDKSLRDTIVEAATSKGEIVSLITDDVRIGEGTPVQTGDTVTVHYTGKTRDGVKFDSSRDRGAPFTFTVGQGKVISGWETGLIGMKVGGQRILVIPADLAYGNRQVGTIPPNTTLIFEVELLKID